MDVFDAAERYKKEGRSLIIIAGKDYGSGSSRDWAAKGPWMLVSVFVCMYICLSRLIRALPSSFLPTGYQGCSSREL